MGEGYILQKEAIRLIQDAYCRDCTSVTGKRCGKCNMDGVIRAIEEMPNADVVGLEQENRRLRIIIKEIYADAKAEAGRAREKMARDSEFGDTDQAGVNRMKSAERERAARRIKSVCTRHGFEAEIK